MSCRSLMRRKNSLTAATSSIGNTPLATRHNYPEAMKFLSLPCLTESQQVNNNLKEFASYWGSALWNSPFSFVTCWGLQPSTTQIKGKKEKKAEVWRANLCFGVTGIGGIATLAETKQKTQSDSWPAAFLTSPATNRVAHCPMRVAQTQHWTSSSCHNIAWHSGLELNWKLTEKQAPSHMYDWGAKTRFHAVELMDKRNLCRSMLFKETVCSWN